MKQPLFTQEELEMITSIEKMTHVETLAAHRFYCREPNNPQAVKFRYLIERHWKIQSANDLYFRHINSKP